VKVAGTLVSGDSPHPLAVVCAVLMSVAKAVAGVPTCTERLLGNTAATKTAPMKGTNVAVIVVSAFTTTVQVVVPLQPPPLQPAKADPVATVTVRVTVVPLTNVSAQSVPQTMPGVVDVTVPLPLPAVVTVSVKVGVVGGGGGGRGTWLCTCTTDVSRSTNMRNMGRRLHMGFMLSPWSSMTRKGEESSSL
jgi:hypothetical protein